MKGLDVKSSVVNGLVVSESIVRESVGEYRSQARSYRLAVVRDWVVRLGREDLDSVGSDLVVETWS